ncbi:DUF4240 domain-containing protein [Cereibacter sphaeroides]|uniref:DUF4240 domain-containing protein n=1 Tax=Cereibacter sphaeroides TaxID=1063 RepID=UPI001F443876|nr:DUF4240 domain-containing protein [Cereibacter sphaeroides]MCE6957627.1 DUF4240 domain-containing protein [Cereibacter sphaeroides]MCE6971285.1 DUF4240 domain-containing protein [Cereibacter sphaeroides]
MLLDEKSFRTVKNTLSAIRGGPPSARLGEAIAVGWGFPNHAGLKAHLERVETGRALPEHHEPDAAALIARLEKFGIEEWTARDIAATFVALVSASSFWTGVDSHSDIMGARVIRNDLTSTTWQEAMKETFGLIQARLDVPWITVRVPHDSSERALPDFAEEIRLGDHVLNDDPTDGIIMSALETLEDEQDFKLLDLLEGIFVRAHPHFPSSWEDGVRIRIDAHGIKAQTLASDWSQKMDIWFATFDDEPIQRDLGPVGPAGWPPEIVEPPPSEPEMFWNLIDSTLSGADTKNEQLQALRALLEPLPDTQLKAFAADYRRAHDSLGTATIDLLVQLFTGGASDDRSDYVKDWIISRGRRVWEGVIGNPDGFVATLPDPDPEQEFDAFEFEEIAYVVREVYEDRHGTQLPWYDMDKDSTPWAKPSDPYIHLTMIQEDEIPKLLPQTWKWVAKAGYDLDTLINWEIVTPGSREELLLRFDLGLPVTLPDGRVLPGRGDRG